ncbi:hypothetical protein Tco_0659174, partial [Tanacetum coccineum]
MYYLSLHHHRRSVHHWELIHLPDHYIVQHLPRTHIIFNYNLFHNGFLSFNLFYNGFMSLNHFCNGFLSSNLFCWELKASEVTTISFGTSSAAASPAIESFVNTSEMLENQEHNKSKCDKGYHAVPPPFTRNFIPFKPDLTFMDEIVKSENIDVITIVTPSNGKKVESNHKSAGVKSNGDVVEPKTVRKNSFRPPVIEDWNSNDESDVEIIPKDKTGNPQQKEYKEKGVIDSGCSRHMTGNKCYLTEYEDYDGGFVSFGDGKGRISKK